MGVRFLPPVQIYMILIIDCTSKKTKEIKRMLDDEGIENQIESFTKLEPLEFNKFSGIIISGGGSKDPAIEVNKFNLIKTLNIPILGICFGHQIIGILFGGNFFHGENRHGEESINFLADADIFSGLDNPSIFIEDHFCGISLPEDFIKLAESKSYEIEAMKHKNKNIYGVQFHPEISGKNGKQVLINFCNICASFTAKSH